MDTVLKKESLYQLLFIACVAVPYFNIYEATFGVWVFTALITISNKYSFTIAKFIACFAAIFVIALIVGSFEDVETYDFMRDIAYLVKPILGLLIGYQLCKDYIKNPLIILVNAGIILGLVHLLLVLHTVGIRHVKNMHQLREFAGYFSDFEVYSVIILFFHKQLGLNISRKKIIIGSTILALSTIFYLSRTNFIQFGILFMALKGYFVINRRSIIVLSSTLLFLTVSYSIIYSYNPNIHASGIEAFLFKIKNAPIEPFKTHVSRENSNDFNDNYRSYENIYTIRQVTGKGAKTILVGEGMGSSVDLKKKVWLQSSFMRFIPFLHNGFMTVFLKSGLLGVIILIYSISLLFKNKKSDNPTIQNINYMLLATGIFLVISYWVFMGLYFTVDSKSIVIGFLIRYRENLIRAENKIAS